MLGCYVGDANKNDRDGVKIALDNMKKKYSKIRKMWADMGYQGKDLKDHIKKKYGIDIEEASVQILGASKHAARTIASTRSRI